MTDGSSQGLFVIVAVVIFGIFVVISYLLFRDKLQTGLASIFSDSVDTVKSDITINPNLITNSLFNDRTDWINSTANTGTSKVTTNNNELTWQITSSKTSNTRNHLLYVVKEEAIKDSEVFSGAIDIFIESYENTSNDVVTSSNVNIRYTNTSGGEITKNSESLDIKFETGKWYTIKLDNFKVENIDASKGLRMSISMNGYVSGTIKIRKPKIEEGIKSTYFVANINE